MVTEPIKKWLQLKYLVFPYKVNDFSGVYNTPFMFIVFYKHWAC